MVTAGLVECSSNPGDGFLSNYVIGRLTACGAGISSEQTYTLLSFNVETITDWTMTSIWPNILHG